MIRDDLLRYEERYGLLSVAEATAIVQEHTRALAPVELALEEALGLVLAEDVVAAEDMPPFAASSVDGYAVIAADDAPRRRVLGEIAAGNPVGLRVVPGTAARIMTGAPLPPGADAIAMIEVIRDVSEAGDESAIAVGRQLEPGAYVHPVGQDVRAGQRVLEAGTTLGPPEVGLLATVGRTRARVHRRPLVAVLSTGDELIEPDQPPRPGAIRDSNRYALMAAARQAGAATVSLGMARDDVAAQEGAIRRAFEATFEVDGVPRRADAVVTSGGVSVGRRDLIKPILERLGTVHFGRIKLKPGKPFTFATVGEQVAFGLPGFPVSSLVTFEVFVRPALLKMQGRREVSRPRVEVELGHELRRTPDRTEYQRAIVSWEGGRLVARGTGLQVSSRLLSMVGANALVEILPGRGTVPAGTLVPALLTGEIRTGGD